jgi:hypothetical protein
MPQRKRATSAVLAFWVKLRIRSCGTSQGDIPDAKDQIGPGPWGPGYAHDTPDEAAADGVLWSRIQEGGDPRGGRLERGGDIRPAAGGG